MATYSIRQIYDAARAAGFSPSEATTWTAIAMAESGGRTGALNSRGEYSMGLWQINVAPGVRKNHWGDLNDPAVNARAAYEVSNQGRDMRPWTTTHDRNKGTAHDYRTYLDEVEAVSGVRGDPRGVAGYGAKLPPPLPEQPAASGSGNGDAASPGAAYDQIAEGTPLGAQVDTDRDGLVDEFERLLGSSRTRADSDGDGLTDAYEVAVGGSNPLSADTDRDTLSDSAEAALGTNAARIDSDDDGITDAGEVAAGTDPLSADAGVGPRGAGRAGPATVTTILEHPTLQALRAMQSVPPTTTAPSTAPTTAPTTGPTTGPPVSAPAAAGEPQSATTSVADRFVDVALEQKGDRYIFGAETRLKDADPDAFDCSELTQWAAHRVGVTIPDGAQWQYLDLKAKDALIPVDQALKTKGALLFYFSREPTAGGGRPARAHVAISLGDGRTIEARGRAYGVNEFAAAHRFNRAGVIPGMAESAPLEAAPSPPPPAPQPRPLYDQIDAGMPLDQAEDTDADGLTDEFERLAGTSPADADSDADGLTDLVEALRSRTDPLAADTDRDGASDAAEFAQGTDAGRVPGVAGVSGTGAFAENIRTAPSDRDQDGLTDLFEQRAGLNPDLADTDADGLSDATEFSLGVNGTRVDTDADGLTDLLEVTLGTDPLRPGGGLPGAGPVPLPVDPADPLPAASYSPDPT